MVSKIVLFVKDLSERQILLILLGITFGLRLYAVLMAKGIAIDSAFYGFMARDFLEGHFIKGLSPAYHPFYPLLISLVSPDASHVEIAGRLISLFFGTFTLIPMFYLVKEGVSQKSAIFSGLFYSFHPYLATYSGMLLSEATYWGLLTLSVYFFWTGLTRKKVLRLITSGAFLGLAYLTKPEGMGYLIIFLIWPIFYGGMKKEWFRKIVLTGGVFLPFFVLSTSYLIHIHRETGQWAISKKGVAVQSHLLTWSKERSDRPLGKVSEGIKSAEEQKTKEKSPKIQGLVKNIVQYIPLTTYHYLRAYHFTLWLFLFFGLIRVRQNGGKFELFLASLVLFHLFSLSTFTGSTIRFSVPLIPISLFWAGAGVLEIQRYLQKIKVSARAKWVSVLIILAILVQLPQSLRPERRHRVDQKKVGLWLKANTPKDSIIMSNSPIEAFYGEREFVLLPAGLYMDGIPGKSYDEIIRYAKERRVAYILVNKNTRQFNPDFERSIRPMDLREFCEYREKDGNITTIYGVIH